MSLCDAPPCLSGLVPTPLWPKHFLIPVRVLLPPLQQLPLASVLPSSPSSPISPLRPQCSLLNQGIAHLLS